MKETTLRAKLRQRLQQPGLVVAPGVNEKLKGMGMGMGMGIKAE